MGSLGKACSVAVQTPGAVTTQSGPTYFMPTRRSVPAQILRLCCAQLRPMRPNMTLTRLDTGGRYWVRTSDLFGVKHDR